MGAVAWSMAAVQLFFCSSHFCEFSGLQYTSSFIGFEDMEWYTSGSLLLVNTFGLTLLCWLSLPLVTLVPDLLVMNGVGSQHRRHHHHHHQQQQQGVKTANVSDRGHVHNNGHISSSGVSAAAPDLGTPRPTTTTNSISSVAEPNNSSSTSRSGRLPRLLCVLLVSSSLQWAKLSVCLVSAWVQQGHILLWAIFAPKLVFELWFMALADACYLAAAGLAALGAW
jgi:phosphatidylinositol glycan class O